MMTEVGKFRALSAKDIDEFLYRRDNSRMDADLSNLRKQRLVLEREIPQHEGQPRRLVALTKEGRQLLVSTKNVQEAQVLYHGFTKLREADHDADLYRLYQRGLEKANREGAKNIRVILDSELKRILYRDLHRAGEGTDETRSTVAERHGLRVVGNTIPVPDLRIEYETASGEPAKLDLELATEHYRFDMKTFMELRNAQAIAIAYDGCNPHPPTFCYLKPYYNDPNKSYFNQVAEGAL